MIDGQETISEDVQVESVAPEEMVSKVQMEKTIRDRLAQATSRVRQEADARHQQELEALRAQQVQNNESTSRESDADAIYQQIQEKLHREAVEKQVRELADSYESKISNGKGLYDDFEDVTADFDATDFPQLIYLVAGLDNAADIVYEISKNPNKLATLDYLAKSSPRKALSELTKLSQSINANKQALSEAEGQATDAPLGRLQPSRISGSNGSATVRDLRKQPYLRG